MKIIGIAGSPRKNGNSETLLDQVLAGAREAGAEVQKARLADLELRFCDACRSCARTGKCRHDDDLSRLIGEMVEADVWVLATPVYCWGPSAQAKCLIDRLYVVCHDEPPGRVAGKKFALVAASADDPKLAAPHLRGMLKETVKYLQMKWAGEVLGQAQDRGEIKKDARILEEARALGKKLAK